jgi:phage shock protein PspC (stress-responsive transcriptional regulator)
MKKSIIVNICGMVFHMDEDAYEVLNKYIAALNSYFSKQTGGREIVEDIESRIVELLQPRLSASKQSITIEDIEEIISILGKPEDIAGSEENASDGRNSDSASSNQEKTSRRLYRDQENAVLGGVASGMGAYFDIDPVIFRIIFFALIFAGGIGFLLYLVLWISVPQAKTISQRLEMKGVNITVSNIEKKIREEYNSVKSNVSKFGGNNPLGKISGFMHELVLAFSRVIIFIAHVFKYVFAVFLIVMALAIIVGSVAGIFFSDFVISNGFVSNIGSIQEFLNYFLIPAHTNILLFLAMAIVLLPCAGFLYWGLKILIRFEARDKWVSAAMSILWFLCIIVFVTLLLTNVSRYKIESSNTERVSLVSPSKNVLYIQSQNTEGKVLDYSDGKCFNQFFGVETLQTKKQLFAPVELAFSTSGTTKPDMEIKRRAYASDYQSAGEAQKAIHVEYLQNDTILNIDPFFHILGKDKWNFQQCRITIYVPEGYTIRFDKNIELFINNWNIYEYPDNELWLNRWKVTADGLELKK